MAAIIDPDVFGAASHRNMIEHLAGPFTAGAVDSVVTVTAAGRVVVPVAAREPVLLIAPVEALGDRRMRVAVVVDPDGAAIALPSLEFDGYTEAGAYLPAHTPAVDPNLRTAAPFVLQLTLSFRDRDDQAVAVPVPDVSRFVQARLLEGALGKVLYTLGAEKQRLRRQLREILAMRSLSNGRWDALDRVGADLGVPRFADRIQYDAAKKEIVAVTREVGGKPVAEPDAEYRRRLKLYYGWCMPTRAVVADVLNGPGADGSPNAGPFSELGLARRFAVEERNNPFAVSVHIVARTGGAAARSNFFQHVAAMRLIFPATFAVNDPHAARLLSTTQRTRLEEQRTRLRTGFTWTQAMALAPAMADALERIARVRVALGFPAQIPVQRAFDAAAGSRYELGLGIDIAPLSVADLDAMHAALTAPNALNGMDASTARLCAQLRSRLAAADPLGEWLFNGCGLQTVHRVTNGKLYLSTLPTFGLVINESAVQPGGGVLALEALYQAPGDPGVNAVLEAAIATTLSSWAAGGEEAITRLDYATSQARWRANTAQPVPARNVFTASGLPAPAALPPISPALDRLPPELIGGVQLGPVLSGQIIAGNAAVVAKLRKLADLLRLNHASSVLPMVTGANQVTLLIGAIGLPQAGVNLSERRATGFRWYALPIEGGGGTVSPVGSRTQWRESGATLSAIVVIGYARRGLVDPYEYRVDLPDDAVLNLQQYEFLMNALERLYPLGVQVNTFAIRRRHVDLDGDGSAEPLPPSIMRTYRKFQRRHRRGEPGVDLSSPT